MTWVIEHELTPNTWERVPDSRTGGDLSKERAEALADAWTREGTLFRFREGGRYRARLVV